MIKIENLRVKYNKNVVIDSFSHEFKGSTITSIIGKNGSGKSTLIKCIMSINTKYEGKIYIDNILVSKDNKYRKNIGYIPEKANLYESLTGFEYLQFIAGFRGVDNADLKINKLVELFEMNTFIKQRIDTFSKGNKKKLVIIAALIHNPSILILDEAFDGLDDNMQKIMVNLLQKLKKMGKTILFISHDRTIIDEISDDIIFLDEKSKNENNNEDKKDMNIDEISSNIIYEIEK